MDFWNYNRYIINGRSSSHGFELKIKDPRNGAEHVFRTSDHDSKEGISGFSLGIFLLVYILLYAICIVIFDKVYYWQISGFTKFSVVTMSFISFALASVLISALITFRRQTAEWHALEHKAVALLCNEIPVTAANLKNAPMNLATCGTVQLTTILQLVTYPWLLIYLPHALTDGFLKTLVLGGIVAIFISTLCHANAPYTHKPNTPPKLINNYFQYLRIPAVIPGLILEKAFTLKEPAEDKLKAVAAELSAFMAKIEASPQTDSPA